MGIRESLLNTITSVADSDFVRIVTSAGASSKATVQNLFKSFETGLGAKSSLTTSDYIRVVGSDNVAYKQSVSAVKTALGIDRLNNITKWYTYSTQTTREELLAKIDADISTEGQGGYTGYMIGTQAVLLGLPSGSYYMTMFANSANYRGIRFTNIGGTAEYLLSKQGGTWASSPTALPTRAEVDAINSYMRLIYTGTVGFAAIDPAYPNDTRYMGGVLDAKVKGVISSLPTGMQLIHGINNGPAFGIVLDKTNDTNYSGIVFTYNASYGKTAWLFSYAGSTYTLRPLSLTI